MKKGTFYLLTLLVIIALGWSIFLGVDYFKEKGGNIGYQSLDVYKIGTSVTSPVNLEPGSATSSMNYYNNVSKTFRTDNVSEIDMSLDLMASTSGVMTWVYYFSDDGTTFYAEDGNTDTSDVVMTHGATAYTHSWTPGVTTHAYKHIDVLDSTSNINSKYFRVTFTPTTASSSLYAEIVTKQK